MVLERESSQGRDDVLQSARLMLEIVIVFFYNSFFSIYYYYYFFCILKARLEAGGGSF